MAYSREDLTNRQFKVWSVVGPAGHQGPARLWECHCSNGHVELITTSVLKRPGVKEKCGKCDIYGVWADLRGRTFGLLEVIERTEARKCTDGGPFRFWRCRCRCGRIVEVRSGHLKGGAIKSCGRCQVPAHMARIREIRRLKVPLLPSGESALRCLLRRYAQSAAKRGLVWELTREQAKGMFEADCFYCGAPPERPFHVWPGGSAFEFNGIDRRNNGEGYTPGNSVPCCFPCNSSKNKRREDEFVDWIARAYHHLKAHGRFYGAAPAETASKTPVRIGAAAPPVLWDDFVDAVLG
jgi:hypothetical protein